MSKEIIARRVIAHCMYENHTLVRTLLTGLFVLTLLTWGTMTALAAPMASLDATGPDNASSGSTFEVTYTLSNTGNSASSSAGLEVTPDALPSGVSIQKIESSGSTTLNKGSVFFLTPIEAGSSVSATYTFKLAEDRADGEIAISGSGTINGQEDSDEDSMSTTVSISAPKPEAMIDANAPEEAPQNGTMTVEYSLTNTGDAEASSGVIAIDPAVLPQGVKIDRIESSGYIDIVNGTTSFNRPISSSETVEAKYTYRISSERQVGVVNLVASGSVGNATDTTNSQVDIFEEPSSAGDAVAGSDGKVAFTDVIDAIEAFNEGKALNGFDLSFQAVLEAINRFNQGG